MAIELEEGDLNLSDSYNKFMEKLKDNEELFFKELEKESIVLPESFFMDFLKQHWNRSSQIIPSLNIKLLEKIIEKNIQLEFPEDNQLNNDIQDTMYMLFKIYKESPSKDNSLFIFKFFISMYKNQLFKSFDSDENKKSFRFIDSIVDFMIVHKMFDALPIIIEFGYQMKMEHYIFAMNKYKDNIERIIELYELNTPLNSVVIEYAAYHGYYNLVRFYHVNNCPWDSKTLYGACKSLNCELIEYCFKEGCEWDPRTLYLFNPYFTKQALENESLNIYREKINKVMDIIKKYTKPIELDIQNKDINKDTE